MFLYLYCQLKLRVAKAPKFIFAISSESLELALQGA